MRTSAAVGPDQIVVSYSFDNFLPVLMLHDSRHDVVWELLETPELRVQLDRYAETSKVRA